MSLEYIQQAFRAAAEKRARAESETLAKQGKPTSAFTVAVNRQKFLVKIDQLSVPGKHYANRNQFFETFRPIVGAVMERAFDDSYKPSGGTSPVLADAIKGFARLNFMQRQDIPLGGTMLNGGHGYSRGFNINWQRSALVDSLLEKPSAQKKLFAFAKDYLKAMDRLGPFAQYNERDYMRIDEIANIDDALQAITQIAVTLKADPALRAQEKQLWLQALSGRIETAPTSKRTWLGLKI